MSATEDTAVDVSLDLQNFRIELTGASQEWTRLCRESLATGVDAVAALLVAGTRADRALELDPRHPLVDRTSNPLAPRFSPGQTAARAIASLTATLAGASEVQGSFDLPGVLTAFGDLGLASVGSQLIAADSPLVAGEDILPTTVHKLMGYGDHAARGYAILLALELAGQRPATGRTAEIPVLFAVPGAENGSSGRLELTVLADGPSGLHPDPAVMAFLQSDSDVLKSVETAWKTAALAKTAACVVWSVTRDGIPCNSINGESMGAAFAVLLDDLAPRGRISRRLRRKTIDSSCAVTAGLNGRTLTEVGGYSQKLQIANDRRLRVIVAVDGLDIANRSKPEGFGTGYVHPALSGAATINEAITLTRTRTNPKFWIAAVAAISVVVITAVVVVVAEGRISDQRMSATAATLSARAGELANSDSRLSALLALGSDRLDSTPSTRAAMQAVVQNNDAVVSSAAVAEGPVVNVTASSETALSADSSSAVRVWSLPALDSVGSFDIDERVEGMDAGPNDAFALFDGPGTLALYQGGAGLVPVEVKSFETNFTGGRTNFYGPFYGDSGQVAALDDDAKGIFWAPGMPDELRFDLGRDPALDGATITGVGEWGQLDPIDHTAAEATLSSRGGLLVLTSDNRVLRTRLDAVESDPVAAAPDNVLRGIDLNTLSMRFEEVVPADTLPAQALSISYGSAGTLLIGTENGVVQWNTDERRIVAFPYGGLAERISIIDNLGSVDGAVVVTRSGLRLVDNTGTKEFNNVGSTQDVGVVTSFSSTYSSTFSNFVVTGRQDGRMTVSDPANTRLTLPARSPSISASFDSDTADLLTTYAYGGWKTDRPGWIESIRRSSVPPPADGIDRSDQYVLPNDNGYPFVHRTVAGGGIVVGIGADRGGGGRIWVYDAESHELLRTLTFEAERGSSEDIILNAHLDTDGHRLTVWNASRGEIGVFSTETWELVHTIEIGAVTSFDAVAGSVMSVSSDGSRAVLTAVPDVEPAGIYRVDLAAGEVVDRVDLGEVNSATISPDGSKILATNETSVRVFDWDGRPVTDFVDLRAAITGQSWSNDAETIAVGTVGGVQLLDAANAQPRGPVWDAPAYDEPSSLTWSPDDAYLAITTRTSAEGVNLPGKVHTLITDEIDWTDALCAIAGSDLTQEEWEREAGDDVDKPALCP